MSITSNIQSKIFVCAYWLEYTSNVKMKLKRHNSLGSLSLIRMDFVQNRTYVQILSMHQFLSQANQSPSNENVASQK